MCNGAILRQQRFVRYYISFITNSTIATLNFSSDIWKTFHNTHYCISLFLDPRKGLDSVKQPDTIIHKSTRKSISNKKNFKCHHFGIEICICKRQFLNKIFCPAQRLTTVPRDIHYVSLPYLGPPSVKLVRYLKNVLQWYYPQVEFKFSLSNSFKIKYFFNYKDHLPLYLRSGIVYKYTCGIFSDSYIGSSVKKARVRFSQHRVFFFLELSCPTNSIAFGITVIARTTRLNMNILMFQILVPSIQSRGFQKVYTFSMEFNPSINIDRSAVQLYIAQLGCVRM